VKTLLVVPFDGRGGVVSVAEDLAKYLREHGHEVVFFHLGETLFLKGRTTPLGFPDLQLRLSFPFAKPRPLVSALAFPVLFPIILLQLMWFLWSRRIQIVNLHFAIDNFFYFAVCRRLLAIRLVTSLHGSDAFPGGKPSSRYSRAFRFLLKASDLIVLPSDAYRRKLLEVFPEVQLRTIFIHNGVDPAQFASSNGQSRSDKRRNILCVTHLTELKGIDVLLRASKPLLTNDETLNLILVGDGPQLGELESLATSLGIRNQIHFVGRKHQTEVATLLHDCEVFVVPSRAESFSIVVIEAMCCRKPVVATAVGGIPEIIEHEVSGILVEPGNPQALAAGMLRVLTNMELKRTLVENGYSRAMEYFCFTRTGAKYETAFASLLHAGVS
jgi:L-malate glycosyltransferase